MQGNGRANRAHCSHTRIFERNRVFRNYIGGAGFGPLMNDNTGDNSFPEEWIASKVKAINPVYFGERDGVSVVEGTDIFFDDLLAAHPEELLGGIKYDCLVKYLDSAIRLPVQVHPTKEFSAKNFGSPYGKTEAWLVLAKRSDDACLYFGFRDRIDLETLKAYADRSLTERDILTDIITPVKVNVGDVYLINAGLIHAIGAGCTVLEVQEPTDFTIQIENWCGESRVSEQEKYLGLPRDLAMSIFDFDKFGEKAVEECKIAPKTICCDETCKIESLIDYDDTPCFGEKDTPSMAEVSSPKAVRPCGRWWKAKAKSAATVSVGNSQRATIGLCPMPQEESSRLLALLRS